MRGIDCLQGSPQWHAARLGIPTCSRFSDILTPKKLEPSKSQAKYIHRLVAEAVLGEPIDGEVSFAMERGTLLETQAARAYEWELGVQARLVGFVKHETLEVGGSPDRLVGDDGGVEIKAPLPHTHVGYLLDGPDADYRLQYQGCIWVTERNWWDFYSHHPSMPDARYRFERDDKVMAAFDEHIPAFLEKLQAAKDRARELGCEFPEPILEPAGDYEPSGENDQHFGGIPECF